MSVSRENGFGSNNVFDPYDVESIASAARGLWTDEALCEQLVERGRSRVKLFDPSRIAATYRGLYRLVAGRPLGVEDRQALLGPPVV